MAYVAGHVELASYLGVTHLPEAGEAVVVAGAMIGGTLGFLWFNCQPAQVFMGDTGALALGAMLGMLSLIARQELLLLVAGGVFVAEAASVILQIASTRWWGRRCFVVAAASSFSILGLGREHNCHPLLDCFDALRADFAWRHENESRR